jgi:hypothetical protein
MVFFLETKAVVGILPGIQSRRLLTKIFKSEAIVIGNADVENLGARGNKTGGCYARYQPFSSIKPGTPRAGLTGRLQNPLI